MSRFRYRIIGFVTLSFTLVALLLPGEYLDLLASWSPWRGSAQAAGFAHLDKLVHAGMFAVCGCLVVLGWLTRSFQVLPLFLGMLVFGVGTEWLQGSIPGRSPDAWDAVADAAGAAVGMALGLLLLRPR